MGLYLSSASVGSWSTFIGWVPQGEVPEAEREHGAYLGHADTEETQFLSLCYVMPECSVKAIAPHLAWADSNYRHAVTSRLLGVLVQQIMRATQLDGVG